MNDKNKTVVVQKEEPKAIFKELLSTQYKQVSGELYISSHYHSACDEEAQRAIAVACALEVFVRDDRVSINSISQLSEYADYIQEALMVKNDD